MRLQVTLLLVCVLFPKALTLRCYQCIPGLSGQCNDTQTDCSDQCAIMTTVTYVAGGAKELTVKGCVAAGQCFFGSLNVGLMKINSKCCSTALCNSNKVPASPNGRKCYTCANGDCSKTMSCEGDEDQCISSKGNSVGAQVKGCVSRSFCTAGATNMQMAGITGDLTCCDRNLCNSAEGVKLSLLIMLVPLISSTLFI
ncbi:hypothetical protein AOLI_G00154830 [Acnodon oligacanthus]